ncbi:Putative phage protein (fragment) [Candidatus Glomeribacter gigasporarum BEG34]|uniref:Putative phage protein n=1 Tax=Candidatus Glomeribacter gigasporarum BEG34 TaxID=1070319 RepID=G2J7D6_9BURK
MKYAQEIIDLMGAYPGRAFRMREIVKYVAGKTLSSEERHRVRMQLAHVMRELETMGCIFRRPSASKRGGYALYRWRS